jgi:hypothetical protein
MMARLDRDMPDGVSIPKSYSTVEDAAAQIAADATPTAYVPDQNVVTGRQPRPGDPGYAKFVADRLAKQTTTRETGGGTQPPYEAPEGSHWSFIGGQWKLYKDSGTSESTGGGGGSGGGGGGGGGNVTTYTASDGKTFTDQAAYVAYETSLRDSNLAATTKAAEDKAARQSAYDLLYSQFKQYGLESLVEGVKDLLQKNVSPSEFSIALQNSKAYQDRFVANQERIAKGLRALSPAEYLSKEDAYQEIMRRYGLPESYYAKGNLGIQEGFNKLIANDVSDAELEDRVITAQERVINANPDILKTLRAYYPGITNGDILAYALDPKNALSAIKRKVTAAEIGVAAANEGLTSGLARAEELATAGVTQKQYQQAAPFIADASKRGTELSSFYGLEPYNQTSAEAEALQLSGSAEAAKKRKQLTGLEQASFAGQAGTAQSALDRGRQGAF